jgi:RecB family exonuclease
MWRCWRWLFPRLSPTLYGTLRVCPLQGSFRGSPGYARRTHPRTRLGTAFHQTLETLSALARANELPAGDTLCWKAVELFREAVAQHREAAERPRERHLLFDAGLVERMELSLALVAEELVRSEDTSFPAVEEALVSRDGLMEGRPDRVERSATGPVIVDFKTGALEREDELAAYEAQCLLYAWLWHENFGVWPVEYRLFSPFRDLVLVRVIEPEPALALTADARSLVYELEACSGPHVPGQRGEHCRVCQFRP